MTESVVFPLLQVLGPELLQSSRTLEETSVDCSSNGQRATYDSAETCQEAGESLGALFAVDNLHGGDVLRLVSNRSTEDRAGRGQNLRMRKRHRECRPWRADVLGDPRRYHHHHSSFACGL